MATRSSILAWRIPWTEETGGLQSMGLQESNMTEQLTHTHTLFGGDEVASKASMADVLWSLQLNREVKVLSEWDFQGSNVLYN